MNKQSDNEIMLEVKAGEIGKLGILYERYKKRVFGFFYHMNGDIAQSEDLVQNVFVRLLSYKDSYKPQKSFASWIFQIARNVNYDAYGKRNKGLNKTDPIHKAEKLANPEDIHAKIILGEDLSTLRLALDQLSLEKKELLILSKLRGLKYKEIAEIMDYTEGNVRTKVHRALHELREIFHQLDNR